MYEQSAFVEERREVLEALIREHPLGLLIVHDGQALSANQVPFVLVSEGEAPAVLEAHIARANPVWQALPKEALVVFQGPQAYVTPSWYPSKQVHGRVVPTWNYVMVQARGVVEPVQDPKWLRGQLDRFTAQQEARRERPWAVDDAPAEFTEQLLESIVGLRIDVRELRGKWKMSQNRGPLDRDGVRRGLEEDGLQGMAALIDR